MLRGIVAGKGRFARCKRPWPAMTPPGIRKRVVGWPVRRARSFARRASSDRSNQPASANRLRQPGHSLSPPRRIAENALGYGRVVITRKARATSGAGGRRCPAATARRRQRPGSTGMASPPKWPRPCPCDWCTWSRPRPGPHLRSRSASDDTSGTASPPRRSRHRWIAAASRRTSWSYCSLMIFCLSGGAMSKKRRFVSGGSIR